MAIINPINTVKANRYAIEKLQGVLRMESPPILSNPIPLAAKFIDQPEPGMDLPEGLVLLAPDDFKNLHETIGFPFNRPHLLFRCFKLEGEHSEREVWKLGNRATLYVDGGGADNRCYSCKNATLIRGE